MMSRKKDMEDGYIDATTIPVPGLPGAGVGVPATESHPHHILIHSNMYHIPYIDTYATYRQVATYTAYIYKKHITIYLYYIKIQACTQNIDTCIYTQRPIYHNTKYIYTTYGCTHYT